MQNSKIIFISAYRNFSIRYILYSDILKELKKAGFKIVVFVKDNDIDYYRNRLKDDQVRVEPVLYDKAIRTLKRNIISQFFVLTRKCMSGNENGYENTTDNVRFYQYGEQMAGGIKSHLLFQVVKLIAWLGKRFAFFRKALVFLESAIFNGNIYDRYFNKYNPRLLIISSIGYMIDPFFMRAAKRNGCKITSIIHSWDNPTTKDYRGALPDHVITWNEIMKREVRVFHDIPDDRIHIGGIAHWDFYFNGNLKPRSKTDFLEVFNLSKDCKTIFYATSNFRLFHRTFDVIENLLIAIQTEKFISPTQLLVRLHPGYLLKDDNNQAQIISRYKEKMNYLEKKFGGLVCFTAPQMKFLNDDIDMPVEDMHLLAETLYHSDLLLTEYSTVMIEAAIFDLPVINVGLFNFRDTDKPASFLENYTHIKRILRHSASKNAYTFDQLFEYIDYYLKDPGRDSENRRQLIDAEITTNRGTAGKAIGKLLIDLI